MSKKQKTKERATAGQSGAAQPNPEAKLPIEERKKLFVDGVNKLVAEFGVGLRPLITPTGPIIDLTDNWATPIMPKTDAEKKPETKV